MQSLPHSCPLTSKFLFSVQIQQSPANSRFQVSTGFHLLIVSPTAAFGFMYAEAETNQPRVRLFWPSDYHGTVRGSVVVLNTSNAIMYFLVLSKGTGRTWESVGSVWDSPKPKCPTRPGVSTTVLPTTMFSRRVIPTDGNILVYYLSVVAAKNEKAMYQHHNSWYQELTPWKVFPSSSVVLHRDICWPMCLHRDIHQLACVSQRNTSPGLCVFIET
jgi:hypothetical protein